jgi:endonuclease YncB( thermonuclease family)
MSNRSSPWATIAVSILIIALIVLPFLLKGACRSRRSTESKPAPQESPTSRPTLPDDFSAQVVGVIDGDTIDVLVENSGEGQASGSKFTVRVRLADIDCPEKGQPFGRKAKQATSDLCFGEMVRVRGERKDRNGRLLGEVILPDGRCLNEELIRLGYAWWFERYSTRIALQAIQSEARDARRGLWAEENPVPPWAWRKRSRTH